MKKPHEISAIILKRLHEPLTKAMLVAYLMSGAYLFFHVAWGDTFTPWTIGLFWLWVVL